MVTYKAIAEFFEDVVLNEGRTDVQAHVGFANTNGQTIDELAVNYFGGKALLRSFTDIDKCEKVFYVYDGDDYEKFAYKHFRLYESGHFIVLDVEDQRIFCWGIEG